jgi:hypothetical protein
VPPSAPGATPTPPPLRGWSVAGAGAGAAVAGGERELEGGEATKGQQVAAGWAWPCLARSGIPRIAHPDPYVPCRDGRSTRPAPPRGTWAARHASSPACARCPRAGSVGPTLQRVCRGWQDSGCEGALPRGAGRTAAAPAPSAEPLAGGAHGAPPQVLGEHDGVVSFETTMSTFPSYFLFSQTMLSDMYSYSVARADDLSWGTKAVAGTSKGSTVAGSALRRTAIARATAARARFGGVHVEAGTNRARQRTLRDEQRLNAAAREASWRSTNALTVLVVVASLSLAVVNSVLNRALQHYLLYVGAATASMGIVIMAGSFVFFTSRALFSPSAGDGAMRFWALCCAAGWFVCAASVVALWLSRDHTAPVWRVAAVAYSPAFEGLMCIAAVRFCCTRGDGGAPHLPGEAHSLAEGARLPAHARAPAAPARAAALTQSASRPAPEYVALED